MITFESKPVIRELWMTGPRPDPDFFVERVDVVLKFDTSGTKMHVYKPKTHHRAKHKKCTFVVLMDGPFPATEVLALEERLEFFRTMAKQTSKSLRQALKDEKDARKNAKKSARLAAAFRPRGASLCDPDLTKVSTAYAEDDYLGV